MCAFHPDLSCSPMSASSPHRTFGIFVLTTRVTLILFRTEQQLISEVSVDYVAYSQTTLAATADTQSTQIICKGTKLKTPGLDRGGIIWFLVAKLVLVVVGAVVHVRNLCVCFPSDCFCQTERCASWTRRLNEVMHLWSDCDMNSSS